MGKSSLNALSMKSMLVLSLCLCSLAIHLFVDQAGHHSRPNLFQQFAEHRAELEHTDYEHEDDFVPFALESANAANQSASKTIAANFLAFSRSLSPLLPPPIAT